MPQMKTQMREMYRGMERALNLVQELFEEEINAIARGEYPEGVTIYVAAYEQAQLVCARWKVLERLKSTQIRLAELDKEVGDADLTLPETPGLIGPNGLPLVSKKDA